MVWARAVDFEGFFAKHPHQWGLFGLELAKKMPNTRLSKMQNLLSVLSKLVA
jgi:hypothetical protein